jgi:molybdopterin molybdotransferase
LSDRSLGFLATLGVGKLRVRDLPRVAVLVTGSELMEPGRNPGASGVFESNGLMLVSALEGMGLTARALRVKDRAALLTDRVRKALAVCDVLLVTGGVSVGESDATKEAFRRAGVRQVFWRVSQKPGGPFYFGRKGEKRVFGLPGNPAAVYSCFHLYARPLLNGLLGRVSEPPLLLPAAHPVKPLRRKTLFAKAVREGGKVKVLGGQGSHLLESLALGNGLLVVPPGPKILPKGTKLEFHPFASPGGSR